jgi:hypothetical protein
VISAPHPPSQSPATQLQPSWWPWKHCGGLQLFRVPPAQDKSLHVAGALSTSPVPATLQAQPPDSQGLLALGLSQEISSPLHSAPLTIAGLSFKVTPFQSEDASPVSDKMAPQRGTFALPRDSANHKCAAFS